MVNAGQDWESTQQHCRKYMQLSLQLCRSTDVCSCAQVNPLLVDTAE